MLQNLIFFSLSLCIPLLLNTFRHIHDGDLKKTWQSYWNGAILAWFYFSRGRKRKVAKLVNLHKKRKVIRRLMNNQSALICYIGDTVISILGVFSYLAITFIISIIYFVVLWNVQLDSTLEKMMTNFKGFPLGALTGGILSLFVVVFYARSKFKVLRTIYKSKDISYAVKEINEKYEQIKNELKLYKK